MNVLEVTPFSATQNPSHTFLTLCFPSVESTGEETVLWVLVDLRGKGWLIVI